MKRLFFQLMVVWMVLTAHSAFAAKDKPEFTDSYAAIVNDRVITIVDVLAAVRPAELQMREMYEGDELEQKVRELYKSGTDALIEQALILVDFEQKGGAIPEQMVDNHINEVIREKFDNNRTAFLKALSEEHLTIDEWRQETKERMVVSYLRRMEIRDKVAVSPLDASKAYEKNKDKYRLPETVHLHMIVLNKGTNDEEIAVKKTQAEGLRKKLQAGEDFAAVAKEESEGVKAAQGGDMGWVKPSDLRSELSAAMDQLQVGEISEIVETESELYLLKLDGRKKASIKSFEEVQKDIEKDLREKEEERLYKAWIDRLKKKYYVKVF